MLLGAATRNSLAQKCHLNTSRVPRGWPPTATAPSSTSQLLREQFCSKGTLVFNQAIYPPPHEDGKRRAGDKNSFFQSRFK